MEKKVLKVIGMSCEHCEKAINDALSELPGVEDIDVSLKERTVSFYYNSVTISLAAICAAIEDEGFNVVEAN